MIWHVHHLKPIHKKSVNVKFLKIIYDKEFILEVYIRFEFYYAGDYVCTDESIRNVTLYVKK